MASTFFLIGETQQNSLSPQRRNDFQNLNRRAGAPFFALAKGGGRYG